MKIAEKIADNKIGILTAVVHWIAFYLAFESSANLGVLGEIGDAILETLFIINLPAMGFAALLISPLYLFIKDVKSFWSLVIFLSLFTITFQWLFTAKALYNLFGKNKSRMTALSLNDE